MGNVLQPQAADGLCDTEARWQWAGPGLNLVLDTEVAGNEAVGRTAKDKFVQTLVQGRVETYCRPNRPLNFSLKKTNNYLSVSLIFKVVFKQPATAADTMTI